MGNSRWHWAGASPTGLRIEHHAPLSGSEGSGLAPPLAWAAVGALPTGWPGDPHRRVTTADVPLAGMPHWLGVDRALAGWLAWRQRRQEVLVADAGTVLSLTRIDRQGRFVGGRLIAGLSLQLRAMSAGTAGLPPPPPAELPSALLAEAWPAATVAAMAVGVSQALAAALVMALVQARQGEVDCQLVLTGGDGPCLMPLIVELLAAAGAGGDVALEPDLALRALVELRPATQEETQDRPRSLST